MYDFDEKTSELNKDSPTLGAVPPFAVIGSSTTKEGQPIRVYPWGTCEGGNEAHSDFAKLRYDACANILHLQQVDKWAGH